MKRIFWISAAFFAMFMVIGISMYSINQIVKSNDRAREEQEAKNVAASIAAATESTTDIWEYLRSSTPNPADEQTVGATDDVSQNQEEPTENPKYNILSDQNETPSEPIQEPQPENNVIILN